MNNILSFKDGVLFPELFIGVISYVSASSVKINFTDACYPSGSHFSGRRYGRGEVGEFVLIEGQTKLLLGRIVEVKLPETERKILKPSKIDISGLDAVGAIQLLGSVEMDSLRVKTGVDNYPRLGDRVYSAPHEFISQLPLLIDKINENVEESVLISVGYVDDTGKSIVKIKPEKLFGRHCAILGTTGGGKSWTTAHLIEECIKYNSKIILIDPTGEYRNFLGDHIQHCSLGSPPDTDNSIQCSLPPNSFIESDFIALFEPAGRVQGPKLRAAIRSLRLAEIIEKCEQEKELVRKGYIEKINQPKQKILALESKYSAKIEDPKQPFNINFLVNQIEQECVRPGTSEKWGTADESSYSNCLSLITRINTILTSPAFRCVFQPKDGDKPILEAVEEFLNNSKRLLRICVSGISYEFRAREIIANALGRALLNKAREGLFNQKPVLIFLDEAHNFLGRSIGSEDNIYRLDAFELIAKEGRKYGLNICLATQRPRDITEGVLSQMGTLIVHRLINDSDREVVERACGEIDRAASSFLPNLKPGEAAIIGIDFPIPLTIQVLKPSNPPISDGPDFQNTWKLRYNKI